MRSFHFETPQHEALECETFIKNMHGKNQDGICYVIGNNNTRRIHVLCNHFLDNY
jgi:hypothetical protein